LVFFFFGRNANGLVRFNNVGYAKLC